MCGEPFRGIVLTAKKTRLRRKIIDRTLLRTRRRSSLETKDEHERCHRQSFRTTARQEPSQRLDPARRMKIKSAAEGFLFGTVALALTAAPVLGADNDYPTSARADYVIGCMAANGNTRQALLRCSCAIDTIASLMPFSHYEQAETALSLQAGGGVGGRVGLFRDPPQIKVVIEELHRAQAEANLRCQ